MDFGRKIKKLRKEKKMKQKDLAKVLGIHVNTLSHWENIELPFKDVRKISMLAEALGTTVDYLKEQDPARSEVGAETANGERTQHISRSTLDLEAIMKDLGYEYPDLAIGFRDTRENWMNLPESDKESVADALMVAFGPEGYVPKHLRQEGKCGKV